MMHLGIGEMATHLRFEAVHRKAVKDRHKPHANCTVGESGGEQLWGIGELFYDTLELTRAANFFRSNRQF